MPGSVRRPFRVVEIDEPYAWLRLLEGEKSGLDFAVEASGFLDDLTLGECVDATVESLNERDTAWSLRQLHTGSER